jgi:hypothetical protein
MTTNLVVRLVGFDRKTDRVVVQRDIPPDLVDEVVEIAGVRVPVEEMGDFPLSTERARRIADMLDVQIDTNANEFFLETSAPANSRRKVRA